jgi:hypothetical protein
MDPADFLDVADRLQASPSEAERRSSIGRSYYALYNVLLGTLSSQGVIFGRVGTDHGDLVHYLIKCGNREAARIGGALRDLRTSRNESDYNMNAVIDMAQSQLANGKAKRAIDRFNKLPLMDLQTVTRSMKHVGPRRHPGGRAP